MQQMELLKCAIGHAIDSIAVMELTDDRIVPIRIVYANPSFERLTGYTREELLDPSNPLLQMQTQNRSLYDKLLVEIRAGKPVCFEVQLRGKDRSTWTEVRWSPFRYDDGPVTHYFAVLRDVSERRKADAERELLYRAIEETADFVVLCDGTPPSQGGPYISYANGAFRNALGYDGEIVGMSCQRLVSLDNDERLLASLATMTETGIAIEKEVRVIRKDRSSFWAEFSARPMQGAGVKERWFVVGRDITLRKQSIEEQALVVRAIDALPMPVEIYGVLDGAAAVVFRNNAAAHETAEAGKDDVLRALKEHLTKPVAGLDGSSLIPLTDHTGSVDAFIRIAR
jgi:PAS domain S-box-containing protein